MKQDPVGGMPGLFLLISSLDYLKVSCLNENVYSESWQ